MDEQFYQRFRKHYEDRHPASVPKLENFIVASDYPPWLSKVVFAMFVTSSLLSGVHTAPTAYDSIEKAKVAEPIRQIVALGTFIFDELGILTSSYLLFKRFNWFAFLMATMCVVIAIVANLHSVSKALETPDFGTQVVGVALGIGAPLVALLSGKLFVTMSRADDKASSESRKKFATAQKKWDDEILKAMEKELKKRETSRNFAKTDEEKPVHETSRTPAKPRVKIHEVAKQVRENGDEGLSAAEMMEKYEIGLGSTTKVRDILSANGHGIGNS